jgi:2-keto-4-pentenoate hydratase/2-oxohepta-3-ene-1,7-dioic acid hydratase in catechol pathway
MDQAMNTVTLDGQTVTPSKIICIGRNYVAHIEELGNEIPDEMVVFAKPNSAIGSTLYEQLDGEQLHYEGEIALMVKGGAPAAVGFGLDLTKRGLQSRLKAAGLPWERAKAFDGAALFSEFQHFSGDLTELAVELEIDGDLRQSGGVELMMYPPAIILAELAKFITLEDGDIIMTGTPAGVGPVEAGASFSGRVQHRGENLAAGNWEAL